MAAKLLENQTANGRGTEVKTDGGNKTFAVWGTFDGATVTLQGSPDDGGTWITLTIGGAPAAFTADAIRLVDRLGQGMRVSCIVSSVGASTDINAEIYN